MAQPALETQPVALDSFTADRFRIWAGFCRFATIGASAVIVLVILMALFLV